MTSTSAIGQKLTEVKNHVEAASHVAGHDVTLVAVSKTKPDEDVMVAYRAGQLDFGENRVQELVGKAQRLPKDIRWHMIGHIQTNKIKEFLPYVHLVHGVDRIKVLDVMEREAAKLDKPVDVLLQVHIAEEDTKFGFGADELRRLASPEPWENYRHIRPVGLMGMATFTENQDQIKREFDHLAQLHAEVGASLAPLAESRGASWGILSMGMSGDWPLAIQSGSTMVRIGSSIFGHRNAPTT